MTCNQFVTAELEVFGSALRRSARGVYKPDGLHDGLFGSWLILPSAPPPPGQSPGVWAEPDLPVCGRIAQLAIQMSHQWL
jgi:hypothetical protein